MPRGVPTKRRAVYVCTSTFFSAFGDARMGERFAEDHVMVRKNPQYFQMVEGDSFPVVEAATAGPGEERE